MSSPSEDRKRSARPVVSLHQKSPYADALLPAPQDRGHDARAAVAVHDSNHPEWRFVRRIGYQVISHPFETQRAAGEVRTAVSLLRERHKAIEGSADVRSHALS